MSEQEEINAPTHFMASGSGDGEVKIVRGSTRGSSQVVAGAVYRTKLVEHGSAGRFWPSGSVELQNGVRLFDGPNSRPHKRGDKSLQFIPVLSTKR